MNEFLVNFLAAGFERSFDKFKLELTNQLEKLIMSLNEQINQLKAGQELNNQKVQSLIETSNQEREQVNGLVTLATNQQSTITELTTKVQELLALVDSNNADNAAAVEAVASLLTATNQQSIEIDKAIAGISDIYNPPAA